MNRFYLFIFFLFGCIEPISITVRDASGDLVVEGWIYDRPGESYVKLSRTLPIGAVSSLPPVTGASVRVSDHQNNVHVFVETTPGIYIPQDVQFSGTVGTSYKLSVVTSDNETFESDLEEMQPSFDDTSLRAAYTLREFISSSGNASFVRIVDFILDVNNPADADVYYKYNWEGTYVVESPFQNDTIQCSLIPSNYEFDLGVDRCYITEQSGGMINILSTEGFTGEKYQGHILTSLGPNVRFMLRYSMLARQFSLSRRAHRYLKAISDQNNNVGGLFDPPPSLVPGNIRPVDGSDKSVYGYFFVSAIQEFRDFFDPSLIPATLPHFDNCDCFPVYECVYLTHPDPNDPPPPASYCCDCRLLPNSSSVKPDFWID